MRIRIIVRVFDGDLLQCLIVGYGDYLDPKKAENIEPDYHISGAMLDEVRQLLLGLR